jgi:hypothetical protein
MTEQRLDLPKRFNYSPPDEERAAVHDAVRTNLQTMAEIIDLSQPNSREKSLAVTHLEEAMFWANAGLARNGISESAWRIADASIPAPAKKARTET